MTAMGDMGAFAPGEAVEYPDRGWRDTECPEDAEEWVKELYDRLAKYPEERETLEAILGGANGDPEVIAEQARARIEEKVKYASRGAAPSDKASFSVQYVQDTDR